ncbi:unnamed protein product [Polarella glacialis]|uniref:Uncharacterized protein n=1 Tax=Polarella glacialis TaxID=89957 RepID=A0A813FJR2_POLGL|nr:unnamed protein product [Polarella glacialis]
MVDTWMMMPAGTAKHRQEPQGTQPKKFRAVQRQPPERQLLLALGRQALTEATRGRQQEAITIDTLLLPEANPNVPVMRAAGMAYADNVKAQGKQHNLGSPHLYVWAALVKQLSQEQDLSPELTTALQQHIATTPSPAHLQSIVRHCRLSKAWAPGTFKLQVAVAASVLQMWNLMKYHLQVQGATAKHGMPPRGPHERTIARLLASLDGFDLAAGSSGTVREREVSE